MTDKQRRIQVLIQSIVTYLQAHRATTRGVDLTLDKLTAMDLFGERLIDIPPQGTRHEDVLMNAIAGIVAPELTHVGITIPISALAFSCWVHGRSTGTITTTRQSFI